MPGCLSRCVLSAFVAIGLLAAPAVAQTKKTKPERKKPLEARAASGPATYASKNFQVHTDLSADEAQDLLKRMETMLSLISKYWGRPPSGVVECWVVKDTANWPEGSIPEEGIDAITGGAGVTHTTALASGAAFVAKSRVYAVADHGTPLHEAVHAYCGHAFGRVGPVWYAEGMAEMGHYWKENDYAVHADEIVIEYLKNSEPKELDEIVNRFERTGDSWQNYAWRWALCHMLSNNPNYAPRFRPLGIGMLTGGDVSFNSVYGSMAKEITFEYLFFLKHLETGLRIDLCAWDWKAKFRKNKTPSPTLSSIDAGHGWQASKLTVEKDVEYEFVTSGTWTLAKDAKPLSGAGDDAGNGRLVGILMDDYKLGEEFDLGDQGTFTAPSDGNLYLRCKDSWASVADNKGKLTVKVKMKGKGAPLAGEGSKPAARPVPEKEKPAKGKETSPPKSSTGS